MAIIITNDIINIADAKISVISTAAGYAKANVMNHTRLKRRWRMNTADKSDTDAVMVFNMDAAKTVAAIVLDDVNFDECIIVGHASDLSGESDGWTGASFSSGAITISKDGKTNRYKAYIPLVAFNLQYIAIIVPTAAAAVGSYTTKWEIGRVVILDSATELTRNMDYGYQRGAEQKFKDLELEYGSVERIVTGILRWSADLPFGIRRMSEETELDTMNAYDMDDVLVFYENAGDTSAVYVVHKDTNYRGTWTAPDGVRGNTIRLTEYI